MEKEMVNPIQALLDENNNANITLFDELDRAVEFEQIALIPLNNQVYAILKPVNKMEGVNDDEALVFQLLDDEEHEDALIIITDDKIIDQVFKVYYKLLEDEK